MNELKELLLQEQKHLESVIAKVGNEQKDIPSGRLRISVDDGKARYYHCTKDRYGEYISKSNIELACRLAQKTYNDSVRKKAEHRLKLITKCLDNYSDDEIEQIYNSLHMERRALVIPVEPTVEQMEEKWFNEQHVGKKFNEEMPVILTEKGERVRSKSEKILADYFYRNDILYKYEKPLYLDGYGIVYPDFTFFSKRLGEEIYWEHEGMMDKPEYAKKAVKKLNNYQMNGIFPGERLILTFETEQEVLNSKIIGKLVDKYLS